MRGRARPIGIILIIIAGVWVLGHFSKQQTASDPQQTALAINIVADAMKEVRLSAAASFDGENTKANDYGVALYYSAGQDVSPAMARADMEGVARAILAKLVSEGHQPANEQTNMTITAWQRTHGETGKELYFDLGNVHYDYNDDQLKYGSKTTWW